VSKHEQGNLDIEERQVNTLSEHKKIHRVEAHVAKEVKIEVFRNLGVPGIDNKHYRVEGTRVDSFLEHRTAESLALYFQPP
jgi:hypothetical protein